MHEWPSCSHIVQRIPLRQMFHNTSYTLNPILPLPQVTVKSKKRYRLKVLYHGSLVVKTKD